VHIATKSLVLSTAHEYNSSDEWQTNVLLRFRKTQRLVTYTVVHLSATWRTVYLDIWTVEDLKVVCCRPFISSLFRKQVIIAYLARFVHYKDI